MPHCQTILPEDYVQNFNCVLESSRDNINLLFMNGCLATPLYLKFVLYFICLYFHGILSYINMISS